MAGYSFLLALALVVSAPWWLWRMATSGRYREGLGERLGRVPQSLIEIELRRDRIPGVIWIHAVSVGEVLASERLITELRAALPDWRIVLSTTTATGQQIAKTRLTGVRTFYFPLDFAFAIRPYLRALQPSLFVMVESELWPRMLSECERAGVPTAVVNARVSDRSFPRYMRLRWLWKPLLGKVSLFLAQGEESAERLRAIGAEAEKVRVSGNLKYDGPGGGDNAMVRRIGSLLFESRLIVAGSTHDDEEQALLAALPAICRAAPDAALLIAPRHPQRFDEVVALVRATGRGCFRCSQLMTVTEPIFGGVVLILDTIGDLAAMYGIASAAFVGGSLVARGGQNPLEAARFGVPVVMGRSYENFREIAEKLIGEGSLRIVDRKGLAEGLIAALERMPIGPRHFEGQTGATRRTVHELVSLAGDGA